MNYQVTVLFFLFIILLLPPVNGWFNEQMYRKLIFENIGLAVSGVICGRFFQRKTGKPRNPKEKNFPLKSHFKALLPSSQVKGTGLTSVFFLIGSVFFWMIPRSLDLAVMNYTVNFLMLVNLFFSGIFLGRRFSKLSFALRAAIIIYSLAMILTLATVYVSNEAVLCAVYNVAMQKETGGYLLKVFPVLFIVALFWAGKNLRAFSKMGDK